jgi:hypothetical protein
MSDTPATPDTPDTYEGAIGTTGFTYRLTRVRLGDVPAGTLVSRRPARQFLEELSGDGYDLVTGLALRSTRALDPVLAESVVWRVEILAPGEPPA